ncbi:MAG TPA: prolipoprotein diacylglyceryl transferase [Bryobacteraceae bacterium]|nr:prolipoprotein diacylglyceryl transferase [Bryobacteraceae bacterium]
MLPQLVRIGDFYIPTYGVMIACGFLVALWMAARLAGRAGFDKEAVLNLGIYCGLAGILGGKLLMVLEDLDYYLRHPLEIFSLETLRAGGVFYGGLLLALATAYFYMRRKRLPVLATADVVAPGLALGHAVGRVGCFAAGCCWGVECDRSWAVTFTDPMAHQLFGTPLGTPLHPAQLYETGTVALTAALLYGLVRREHRPGTIIGLYLLLYSLARFVIEFFRAPQQPNPFGGPLTVAQWISVGLFAAGALILWRRGRLHLPAAGTNG